jgi:hypothetical protein
MSYLDEVRLDKPTETPPDRDGRSGGPWVAAAVVVLLAALVAAVVVLRRAEPQEPPGQAMTDQPVAEPTAAGQAERGENIDLPPLDATDPIVRKLVQQLSSHPKAAAWLATPRLLRNFAVVTLNVSEGRSPASHLRPLMPSARFRPRQAVGTWSVDPRSYERYDGYADAIGALDARGTARLYATLKPRIVEAYAELGVAEADVDAVLERAIIHLLATPVVEGNVRLREKTISYAFADERLESLSAAQKHLLRMGPRNVRIIQAKLRDLSLYLGIPRSKLP